MNIEGNRDKYVEEFIRKCELLKEPDGSVQQDIVIPLFVGEYLNPNFYIEYPKEWKRASEVFELEGDVEIEGTMQRVKQRDIIKRSDRGLFEEGIKVFEEETQQALKIVIKI